MRLVELTSALFRVRAITAIHRNESGTAARLTAGSVIRYAICAGLVVLFVWSNAHSVIRALAGPLPDRMDAFHSSNAYLQKVTGSPYASQRIIDVMDSLPPEKPLLIFERERDPVSSLLGMTLAYLAWPHEVRFETIDGPRCDQQLGQIAPNSVGGIAFCDIKSPPWIPGGILLGESGKLITFGNRPAKTE